MPNQSRVQVLFINRLVLRFKDAYCPYYEGVFKRQQLAISRLVDNNMDEWTTHQRLTSATLASTPWYGL